MVSYVCIMLYRSIFELKYKDKSRKEEKIKKRKNYDENDEYVEVNFVGIILIKCLFFFEILVFFSFSFSSLHF